MIELVDAYLIKCLDDHLISSAQAERSQAISNLIIISYTITGIIILCLNSLVTYLAVMRLERLMKYYTEMKLEQELLIPISQLFGNGTALEMEETVVGENS